MVRITEDDCRIVGFVRRISEDSLFLATGDKGFPTRHPRSGIEEYALLE